MDSGIVLKVDGRGKRRIKQTQSWQAVPMRGNCLQKNAKRLTNGVIATDVIPAVPKTQKQQVGTGYQTTARHQAYALTIKPCDLTVKNVPVVKEVKFQLKRDESEVGVLDSLGLRRNPVREGDVEVVRQGGEDNDYTRFLETESFILGHLDNTHNHICSRYSPDILEEGHDERTRNTQTSR